MAYARVNGSAQTTATATTTAHLDYGMAVARLGDDQVVV